MSYSENIKHPAYKKLRIRNAAVKILVFIILTGAVGTAVFTSSHTNNAIAAVITIAAAAFSAYLLRLNTLFDKDWDGVVIAKEKQYTYSKTAKMIISNPRSGTPKDKQGNTIPYTRSFLKVQKEDGEVVVYSDVGEDELPEVDYYRIGDRVRHHKGLKLYEKEDKSKDRHILCLSCLKLTPKDAESCQGCGLPLLK